MTQWRINIAPAEARVLVVATILVVAVTVEAAKGGRPHLPGGRASLRVGGTGRGRGASAHRGLVTEDEARAALRAFVAVEPWIAAQEWEATPDGWTVPVPLDGRIFRLGRVPGGVRVSASMGRGLPAVWIVPA